MSYKYHEYIDNYIKDIKKGKIRTNTRLKKAIDLVERKLSSEKIFIDDEKIKEAKRVIETYFKIKLLNWQLFIISLIHCYNKNEDTIVFDSF